LKLAIFDLDNTLLAGDSDYLWGEFLIERGVVDGEWHRRENERYYRAYKEGGLDIYEFLRFSLRALAEHPLPKLHAWRDQFVSEKIIPIMLPAAQELLNWHRRQGHTLLIITATNRFITAPIATLLGVPHLIATEPALVDGRYTGDVEGVPSFQEGKVTRLIEWMGVANPTFEEAWFYSDSHNDLPLLNRVGTPVAVDPDEALRREAKRRGWRIISLRKGAQAVDLDY